MTKDDVLREIQAAAESGELTDADLNEIIEWLEIYRLEKILGLKHAPDDHQTKLFEG